MKDKILIALADDEVLIRKGIKNLLGDESDFQIILDVNNGEELLQQLENHAEKPNIILMDINMPVTNGIDATKIISEKYPDIKIIALSSYKSDVLVSKMMDMGAVAYLHKSIDPEKINLTIHSVMDKGYHFESDFLQHINPILKNSTVVITENFFTRREIEILRLICREYTSSEIARKLNLSVRTVEGHRNNIILKSGSKNIAGLVVFAIRHSFYTINEGTDFL